MTTSVFLIALLLAGATGAAAQDWPDFRGPGGQGHSSERGLPLEWNETRNVAWKTAVPGLGWSSPVVANGKVWITTAVEQPLDSARDKRGISLRALAYDVATGKEIWRVRYDEGFSNVPRPVFAHGLVFIATGFQQPALLAVRPDGTGDVTKTHVAWTLKRGAPLTPSPVIVGDELYLVNDGDIASCIDARSGTILWQQRLGGTYSASPVYADGRIYFLAEQGVTTVIAPAREFRRLVTNVLDGGLLASMAVSSGSLFLRTDSHLYRITETPR